MKILGISGSSRIKHTNYMLKTLLDATGADYNLIKLKDQNINPCTNCKACHKTFKCIQDDDMQKIYSRISEADIVVLGSPTYFSNVSGIMKNFMDRCCPFYFSEELKNKKVVLLAMGGFKSLVDYDDEGNCIRCKKNDECDESVLECLKCLRAFSGHLGMNIVGETHAIHGDPTAKKNKLIEIGRSLIE